jgi:hypothetical protein
MSEKQITRYIIQSSPTSVIRIECDEIEKEKTGFEFWLKGKFVAYAPFDCAFAKVED